MKKKILVIGASGLIGNAIFHECLNFKYDVYGTIKRKNKKYFFKKNSNKIFSNIRIENDKEIVKIIKKIKPNIVINCAAVVKKYIDLYSIKKIFEINSKFPKKLEHLTSMYNFKLIHISTDCVFDGKHGNYSEDDIPNPQDIYGLSKYFGEVKSDNCLTIRTSVIGPELKKSQGLYEWFMKQNGKIKGYKKFIFSGLTSFELSKIIISNLSNFKLGSIVHISSKPINKFELLKKFKKTFSKKDLVIKECNKIKINRSLISNFQKKNNIKISSWNKMLSDMKTKIDENI